MVSSTTFQKVLVGSLLLAFGGIAQAVVYTELLTKGGTILGGINGGLYTQMAQQPTGTGYIDPFVRVGMQGSAGKDVVQAYNTTVNGVLNNSNEDTWNHAVQFGQLAIVSIGGKGYVRFLLDINQNSGGSFNERLNLDDVQIFLSTVKNQSTTQFLVNGGKDGQLALTNSNLVYRMDVPKTTGAGNGLTQDHTVTLDYSLNSGSGSGDMYLDIPVALFEAQAGVLPGGLSSLNQGYVYLYSKFGSNPYVNNDGFEEWAFLSKTNDGGGFSGRIPEPSSLALAGLGLFAICASRKRPRKQV